MFPEWEDEAVGLASLVAFWGNFYVLIHFFDPAKHDWELSREAILNVVHEYFREADWERIWFYVDKPHDDEIIDLLAELGFDHFPEDRHLPYFDFEKRSAFLIWRHTYDAYYGEDEDGPEELEI